MFGSEEVKITIIVTITIVVIVVTVVSYVDPKITHFFYTSHVRIYQGVAMQNTTNPILRCPISLIDCFSVFRTHVITGLGA